MPADIENSRAGETQDSLRDTGIVLPKRPDRDYLKTGQRDASELREYSKKQQVHIDIQENIIAKLNRLLQEGNDAIATFERQANDRTLQADQMALIAQRKDLFFGDQIQDASINYEFQRMFERIKTWANEFVGSENLDYQLNSPSVEEDTMLRVILPGYQDINNLKSELRVKKFRKRFVRAWLGLSLTLYTLKSSRGPDSTEWNGIASRSDLWYSPEVANAIEMIENSLYQNVLDHTIPLRQMHDWRAFTSFLLSNRISSNEPQSPSTEASFSDLNEIISIQSRCVNFIHPLLITNKIDSAFHELRALIISFIKFSRNTRSQRAHWTIDFEPWRRLPYSQTQSGKSKRKIGGSLSPNLASEQMQQHVIHSQATALDPNTMDDVDEPSDEDDEHHKTPSRSVRLRLSPALFKSGNASGQQYDIDHPMVKSLVSCIADADALCRVPTSGLGAGVHVSKKAVPKYF